MLTKHPPATSTAARHAGEFNRARLLLPRTTAAQHVLTKNPQGLMLMLPSMC